MKIDWFVCGTKSINCAIRQKRILETSTRVQIQDAFRYTARKVWISVFSCKITNTAVTFV